MRASGSLRRGKEQSPLSLWGEGRGEGGNSRWMWRGSRCARRSVSLLASSQNPLTALRAASAAHGRANVAGASDAQGRANAAGAWMRWSGDALERRPEERRKELPLS
jgi:hypothetical protein